MHPVVDPPVPAAPVRTEATLLPAAHLATAIRRTRAFFRAPAAVLPADKAAHLAARRAHQVEPVVAPRQAQPAVLQVARAVRQEAPRCKRRDRRAVAHQAPRDRIRRAVPMAAAPRPRRAVVPRVLQAPTGEARLPRVTGQQREGPLVAQPAHRVPVKMERKVTGAPVPAAKHRSLATKAKRAAVHKRTARVRRERVVLRVPVPASRAQVAIPLRAREVKAAPRIPPRVLLRAPVRMPAAARARVVRRAAMVARPGRLRAVAR